MRQTFAEKPERGIPAQTGMFGDACHPSGHDGAAMTTAPIARCHIPVTQFVSDYSLGRYEIRLQIADFGVCGEDVHKVIHRICG
jgi:hypothetical protein